MDEHDLNELAAYNSRKLIGIMHTPEYVEKMKRLQEQFDKDK